MSNTINVKKKDVENVGQYFSGIKRIYNLIRSNELLCIKIFEQEVQARLR
jgi:hypothetical protein